MEKKQKKKYIEIIILSISIILVGISIIFTSQISTGIKKLLYTADVKVSKDDMVVHYINVGQGDAIALRMPNEKVMLIDSGPKDSQNIVVEYLKNEVLASNNHLVIDYMILTHPDTDHSGGMCAIFSEFEVKKFFRPNIASESEALGNFPLKSDTNEYDEVINKSNLEKGLEVSILSQEFDFYIGEVRVQIFPPVRLYDTTNEMSSVIKVSYMGKSFLFTGDIQEDSEKDMIDEYGLQLDADVLKVAHHGSKTSSSSEFLEIVTPQYAIISVGNNNYGHPHFITVSRLQNVNAEILLTSNGNIRFVCGREMFGVLDKEKIHSFEFIEYWVIALIVEMVLIGILIKNIINLVKLRKIDVM